jgi:predicted DNA-binding transcriptional regulator YafY
VRHIEDVKMSDEPITSRPDFDLHTYWEEAREHLEERVPPFALMLHIAPTARARIQGDFTVLREEPDGSAIIQMHMESAEAAVAYALALSTEARVISPAEVREAVAGRARAIVEMYDGQLKVGDG